MTTSLPLSIKILDPRLITLFGGIPVPASEGAAAVDVSACAVYRSKADGKPELGSRADILESITIGQDVVYVGLGFSMAGPAGWAALLIPRSGLGSAKGLVLGHSTGLIDIADYRGEVIAPLWNRTGSPIVVSAGERVAQMFLVQTPRPDWTQVDELPASARAHGGFGSTGS
jgi:dUTP pyrophosphatase